MPHLRLSLLIKNMYPDGGIFGSCPQYVEKVNGGQNAFVCKYRQKSPNCQKGDCVREKGIYTKT
jgi:hypothetical protein